ncbi:MAG: FAD-dependent oxidoreductase [Lachnospiraceae bacterium]|nr:FAD-dependent oxidoreductase [Lachnospiraceae bacterium]
MIKVDQIRIPVGTDFNEVLETKRLCAKKLGVKTSDLSDFKIIRRSIDARKKPDEVYFVYSACLNISGKYKKSRDVNEYREVIYKLPDALGAAPKYRPVVVGMGPAGLFAALILAKCGYRPIVLERGKKVEDRQKDVSDFFDGGKLLLDSNVQFGEGGAGAFSDGKLSSQVKDKEGRINYILNTFAKCGANEDILYEYKPHVGTDVLMTVVSNIRNEIIASGGEVRYQTCVSDIITSGNSVTGLKLKSGDIIETDHAILAIGHSARDLFFSLYDSGVNMQAKDFAVGLRVEHPQELINERQYGKKAALILPAASYRLSCQTRNERGVYSFCMCPGGYVVNASSENGFLAVNGMSYSKRDSENANSAIVVSVGDKEFDKSYPLSGIKYQRELEKKAFELARGAVPQQFYKDFKNKEKGNIKGNLTRLKGIGEASDLSSLFSDDIFSSFCEGMEDFGKKIPGFAADNTLLSGVESRTSSPVRIPRDNRFVSNYNGLYPCGEGAGYAGGILSAAIDGMKVAEAVIKDYAK